MSDKSNDELAEAFGELMIDLHARIDALADGQMKTRAQRLANVAHGSLEALREHLADGGQVQPFSGGDPKPPTP